MPPKKKPLTKISYTNKGTVPTALQYSNINPCYTITKEVEDNAVHSELELIKTYIDARVYDDFIEMKKIYKQVGTTNHRIDLINGVKYVHVTSFLTPETPKIPFIEDHAELGTALDTLAKNYADMGQFVYDGSFKDRGNISVTYDEVYHAFQEKMKENRPRMDFAGHSLKCQNDEFKYVGELDLLGTFEGALCVFDVKKTKNISKALYDKYMMQMASYAVTLDSLPDLMCILTPWQDPIIEGNIEKYFRKALIERGKYAERFGI